MPPDSSSKNGFAKNLHAAQNLLKLRFSNFLTGDKFLVNNSSSILSEFSGFALVVVGLDSLVTTCSSVVLIMLFLFRPDLSPSAKIEASYIWTLPLNSLCVDFDSLLRSELQIFRRVMLFVVLETISSDIRSFSMNVKNWRISSSGMHSYTSSRN